ncbi:YheC/YheD family endospore coat-associated protein [Litchfieldia salsa]|uniref:YheC/D like ATP-grasp n=1 Tax=Litchfieldia salsa TaxID=930152 RepID=A0A1H0UWP4_9BACI|nr:YheC/YheD family protein [Litchfieldia salsa]SDP70679.1 YheC/D like ATP-grasp [Litchfieldia salsa]
MTKKIQIEIRAESDELFPTPHTIKISGPVTSLFKIEQGQPINLYCGRNSQEVQTVSIKESEPIIYCSLSLLKKLSLPHESFSITFAQIGNHTFSLGPILCVVTEIRESKGVISLGSIEGYCEELATYCERLGILFYLTGLTLFHENVGYIFQQGSWKKSTVPNPHVVHNRIHSRKREKSELFKQFSTKLTELEIPYYNDHFLNKWEVHEVLEKEEHLSPYVPETNLLLNKQVLEEMLAKHSYVFIKPIHGSQGRKIFKINVLDDGSYELDYTTFAKEMETKYDTIHSLFLSLRTRLNKQGYIIQQGIPLFSYQGRPLDFRFLCQKAEKNDWKITSIVARVSAKDDFVSNLSRGGEVKKIEEVLKESFLEKDIRQIKKLMSELATEIASLIDSSIPGFFGELGIDLALDKEGKPWLIEVNTKPSKDQDPKRFSSKIRPSAKAIIKHCLYLANYPEE